jgi:hypothetical protein
MEILPNGDLRIVFSGPFRLVKMSLGKWTVLDVADVRASASLAEQFGHFSVRDPANDQSALTVFDLAGTSALPFPIELIVALDLPLPWFQTQLAPHMKPLLASAGPFSGFRVAAGVVRLFRNGFGSVVFTVDLKARNGVNDKTYLEFLQSRLAGSSPTLVELKNRVRAIVQQRLSEVCTAVARFSVIDENQIDGEIHFLSTFHVFSADWDDTVDPDLCLAGSLRSLLEPEPGEPLANQSNTAREFVMFTSGFHIYVWNRRHAVDHTSRIIALVSFLTLMNILWAELDSVKNTVMEMIETKRVPLFAPTDLDERLEILYSQIMVSSVSWRRDSSSFRDQVDRRWRISELKDYCFSLIAALEARSARRRSIIFGGILAFVTIAQIFSVIEDGWQLYDRVWGGPPTSARSN